MNNVVKFQWSSKQTKQGKGEIVQKSQVKKFKNFRDGRLDTQFKKTDNYH